MRHDQSTGRQRPKSTMLQRVMGVMSKLMPAEPGGENGRAVQMFYRMNEVRDWMTAAPLGRAIKRMRHQSAWPVTAGVYVVGNASGSVAVCTLTSLDLMTPLAGQPDVAIAGRVYVPNLGIERIIVNVTANPAIRFLVLCGKESPIFHPAQALLSLLQHGVTSEGRIIGAEGHLPVLNHIPLAQIAVFRQQIELVDCVGETNVDVLAQVIRDLAARNPGRFLQKWQPGQANPEMRPGMEDTERFKPIRPGGHRQPLAYDPKGFFIITLDRSANEIILRHYLPDNSPAHEMRGRSAEGMLLGLVRENLVSQLSHAGYLGGELAKAEAALRLKLPYEQDQPLRGMKTAG